MGTLHAVLVMFSLCSAVTFGGTSVLRAEDFVPVPPSADTLPAEFENIGVTEHLGEVIPLDVRLRDETGREVRTGDFLRKGHPLMVNFVYHSCPTLCSMVVRGFLTSLQDVPWTVGKEFEVLTVSIDPNDTPAIATAKKEQALGVYGREQTIVAAGWHFLTGDAAEVKRLADAIGFTYRYDAAEKQFAHSAALFVVSAEGKIARYLYGIEFPPLDVRLALAEAAEGRTVSTVDHLLLYCYRYDPSVRSYVLYAMNLMRLAGVVTTLALGVFLTLLWKRDRNIPFPSVN